MTETGARPAARGVAAAPGWPTGLSGGEALRRYAPAAGTVLQRLVGTLAADPYQVALTRWACADAHGLTPLPAPAGTGPLPAAVTTRAWCTLPAADRTVLQFAEQFATDVSALGDEQRLTLWTVLGEQPQQARGRLLAMAWVADLVPRVRAALDRLFESTHDLIVDGPAEQVDDATPLARELVRVVYTLHELDPVLSEMVRLRGARAHHCRLCASLRSRPALVAGGTESDFAVDDLASARLSAAQRAALALVDGMLWSPGRLPEDAIDAVRLHFTPAQAVELVLDVMRNAWNKTTVAAQLDQANVTDGIEVYEYHDDGTIEFVLPPARSRE